MEKPWVVGETEVIDGVKYVGMACTACGEVNGVFQGALSSLPAEKEFKFYCAQCSKDERWKE